MVLKNSYAIGDQVAPTNSPSGGNLAATGDVPTFGSVTGTAPVVKAVSVTNRSGQMISVSAAATDAQRHYFTDSSGALSGRSLIEVQDTAATLPTGNPHTFLRCQDTNFTSTSGFKAIIETTGIIRVQTGGGTGILSLNGAAKPADGRYFVEILYVVNATTAANGSIQARLLDSTGALVGSVSPVTAANLGTAPLINMSWVKPDAVAAVSNFLTGTPTFDPGATAFAGPPSSGITASLALSAPGVTSGSTITVPTGAVVTATASNASGGTGTSYRYSFDFGDGTGPTTPSSTATATHTYTTAGDYTVSLYVTKV